MRKHFIYTTIVSTDEMRFSATVFIPYQYTLNVIICIKVGIPWNILLTLQYFIITILTLTSTKHNC